MSFLDTGFSSGIVGSCRPPHPESGGNGPAGTKALSLGLVRRPRAEPAEPKGPPLRPTPAKLRLSCPRQCPCYAAGGASQQDFGVFLLLHDLQLGAQRGEFGQQTGVAALQVVDAPNG